MIRSFKNGLRFILVTIGIVALTSLSIDATDTLNGSQTALTILTKKITEPECREGMVMVRNSDYDFCIDIFEVSPSEECIYKEPASAIDTSHNIADEGCVPVSESEKAPWTFVAYPQAEQLCAKIGKSLPTAQEWFVAALGTPDSPSSCNLRGPLSKTGFSSSCKSGIGAVDMVGNVWELVKGDIVDGEYLDRDIPEEGYVDLVDESGIALNTTDVPNAIYNKDYFWSDKNGQYALMRGGYHGSRDDGGIYSVYTKTDKNFSSSAIGFRCVDRLR